MRMEQFEGSLNRVLAIVLAIALNAPAQLAAQTTSEGSWQNLSQLQPGQKIEVVETDLKTIRGDFVRFSDDSIALRDDGREASVPRSAVHRVSIQEPPKRARNAWIGLGAGAGVGALIGGTNPSFETRGASAIIGALFGGGIGAATGAALPLKSRHTIYRAPRTTR